MTMKEYITSMILRFVCTMTILAAFGDCCESIYAKCHLVANPNLPSTIDGEVLFKQAANMENGTCEYDDIEVEVYIRGYDYDPTNTLHGFHVHTYGDLFGGCETTGGHFNTLGTLHGSPKSNIKKRHVGDWGSVKQRKNGRVKVKFSDYVAKLQGTNSIVGRAIVLHATKDDLGRGRTEASEQNGNTGPRMACGIVGLSAPWDA